MTPAVVYASPGDFASPGNFLDPADAARLPAVVVDGSFLVTSLRDRRSGGRP